jgi:hypothetical protein
VPSFDRGESSAFRRQKFSDATIAGQLSVGSL